MINKVKSFAVIFNYSFDADVAVYLFDTWEQASEFLRESILNEYKIQTEENETQCDYHIAQDNTYGYVTTNGYFGDEIMEARVGQVYNQ